MDSEESRIAKHMSKPSGMGGVVSPRSAGGPVKLGAGNPKCPRCQKSVYANEKVVAIGQEWHIACLKCTACQKRLDPVILTEHEGQPYCKGCYGAKFGPKGFGYVTTQHTEGGTGQQAVNAAGPESTNPAPAAAPSGAAKFCVKCGTPAGAGPFCAGCGNKF